MSQPNHESSPIAVPQRLPCFAQTETTQNAESFSFKIALVKLTNPATIRKIAICNFEAGINANQANFFMQKMVNVCREIGMRMPRTYSYYECMNKKFEVIFKALSETNVDLAVCIVKDEAAKVVMKQVAKNLNVATQCIKPKIVSKCNNQACESKFGIFEVFALKINTKCGGCYNNVE